jgi:outer membrane lipoprotein-sorting protein
MAVALLAFLVGPPEWAWAQSSEVIQGLVPETGEAAYRGRKMVIDFSRLTPQVTKVSILRALGGKERREFPASRGLVVTDGAASWQYFPEKRQVIRRPAPRGEATEVLRPEQLRRALASYEVRGGSAGIVAGRLSRLLEFCPRQAGSRPLRKVWIDVDTGLVLRTEIYDHQNRLTWLSVFETIEYRPAAEPEAFTLRVPPGVAVVDAPEERCYLPEEAVRASGLPLGLPEYLPAGFARTCIHARRHRDYGEIQVLYSDGLSLLSLFESTHFHPPGGGAPEGVIMVGPWPGRWYDLGSVTALAWGRPGRHLALLGELARGELHKIATSVRQPEEPSTAAQHP